MEKSFYIKKLNSTFDRLKEKNSSYSLRAYANYLDIHPGSLSSILKGGRPFPLKKVDSVCDRLLLSGSERQHFLKSIYNRRTGLEMKSADFTGGESFFSDKDHSSLQVLSQWENFAILSLIKLTGFKSELAWISKRLGIDEKRAKVVVGNLEKASLISIAVDGEISRVKQNLRTSEDINSYALMLSHKEELSLAKEKLELVGINERDFSSITMPTDTSKIKEAKLEIREFREKISRLLESGEKTEVYQLCIQLYPLTEKESIYEN